MANYSVGSPFNYSMVMPKPSFFGLFQIPNMDEDAINHVMDLPTESIGIHGMIVRTNLAR